MEDGHVAAPCYEVILYEGIREYPYGGYSCEGVAFDEADRQEANKWGCAAEVVTCAECRWVVAFGRLWYCVFPPSGGRIGKNDLIRLHRPHRIDTPHCNKCKYWTRSVFSARCSKCLSTYNLTKFVESKNRRMIPVVDEEHYMPDITVYDFMRQGRYLKHMIKKWQEQIAHAHAQGMQGQAAERRRQLNHMLDVEAAIAEAIDMVQDNELRTLLNYRYLTGWSWGRIADAMHCNMETIERMRKYAMDTLNALLQGKVLALDENGRVAVNQMNIETLLEAERKQRKNAGGD